MLAARARCEDSPHHYGSSAQPWRPATDIAARSSPIAARNSPQRGNPPEAPWCETPHPPIEDSCHSWKWEQRTCGLSRQAPVLAARARCEDSPHHYGSSAQPWRPATDIAARSSPRPWRPTREIPRYTGRLRGFSASLRFFHAAMAPSDGHRCEEFPATRARCEDSPRLNGSSAQPWRNDARNSLGACGARPPTPL